MGDDIWTLSDQNSIKIILFTRDLENKGTHIKRKLKEQKNKNQPIKTSHKKLFGKRGNLHQNCKISKKEK